MRPDRLLVEFTNSENYIVNSDQYEEMKNDIFEISRKEFRISGLAKLQTYFDLVALISRGRDQAFIRSCCDLSIENVNTLEIALAQEAMNEIADGLSRNIADHYLRSLPEINHPQITATVNQITDKNPFVRLSPPKFSAKIGASRLDNLSILDERLDAIVEEFFHRANFKLNAYPMIYSGATEIANTMHLAYGPAAASQAKALIGVVKQDFKEKLKSYNNLIVPQLSGSVNRFGLEQYVAEQGIKHDGIFRLNEMTRFRAILHSIKAFDYQAALQPIP